MLPFWIPLLIWIREEWKLLIISSNKSQIIAQSWNKEGKNPLLHPVSDHIRDGSWQKIILICILKEKWHIMMDTEMENCQGNSKGLKKNQIADKLLNILPKESQTSCEIQSLAMSC